MTRTLKLDNSIALSPVNKLVDKKQMMSKDIPHFYNSNSGTQVVIPFKSILPKNVNTTLELLEEAARGGLLRASASSGGSAFGLSELDISSIQATGKLLETQFTQAVSQTSAVKIAGTKFASMNLDYITADEICADVSFANANAYAYDGSKVTFYTSTMNKNYKQNLNYMKGSLQDAHQGGMNSIERTSMIRSKKVLDLHTYAFKNSIRVEEERNNMLFFQYDSIQQDFLAVLQNDLRKRLKSILFGASSQEAFNADSLKDSGQQFAFGNNNAVFNTNIAATYALLGSINLEKCNQVITNLRNFIRSRALLGFSGVKYNILLPTDLYIALGNNQVSDTTKNITMSAVQFIETAVRDVTFIPVEWLNSYNDENPLNPNNALSTSGNMILIYPDISNNYNHIINCDTIPLSQYSQYMITPNEKQFEYVSQTTGPSIISNELIQSIIF